MKRPTRLSKAPSYWQGAIDRPNQLACAVGRGESLPVDVWTPYLCPTINQVGPSCVWQAWANWMEAMIRRYVDPLAIPPGYQIDADTGWRHARKMFWGGDMTGGLYLPQGFAAAKDLGWMPPDATLRLVGKDWDSVNAALYETPLVQGHRIHSGWFRADKLSGCIDHEPSPDGRNAHSTLLTGTLEQLDKARMMRRWRVGMGSWGASHGRYGLFVMTDEEWLEGAMDDGPYTADVPDIEHWTGWRAGLVKAA